MKHSEEYDRFTALVDRVIAVPHSVIKQRVEEHRKASAANPNRPGRKPKALKPSASAPEATDQQH